MVAEAEVCYSQPISIHAIRRSILVCAKWRTFFRIISSHQIADSDFSRAEASFEVKLKKLGWKPPCLFNLCGDMLECEEQVIDITPEPRAVVAPEAIPARTLKMLERSVTALKKGRASASIDL
jgi:hypothetical protein